MLKKIYQTIDENKNDIISISRHIHANPELAFQEYKASELLKNKLAEKGFNIEPKAGGLDTAFKAEMNRGNFKLAFLAEYDALPEIGHGCGHNIISAASYGAAIGLAPIIEKLDGGIALIGTPAEESGGGKIILIENGVFDDIDFAMMIHPATENLVKRGGLAISHMNLQFKGKAAHSASPEDGINALNAVIQTFNGINALRAEFPTHTNVNGIITKGGTASNVITDLAECAFSIRALTLLELKDVLKKIYSIIESVQTLTQAKAEIQIDTPYSERYSNGVMDERFKKHLTDLGEDVEYPDPNKKVGSSDIGNVTIKLPAIHNYIKIGDGFHSHSKEFAKAAVSEKAEEMTIKAAKALSATAYDILSDKSVRSQIIEEFKTKVPDYSNFKIQD